MLKRILVLGILLISVSLAYAQESITITTYYPSPYGSYRELRAQRMAIGDNYSNNSTVCWENCPLGVTPVPAATDLVIEGNVGIGTIDSADSLSVMRDLGVGADENPLAIFQRTTTAGLRDAGVRLGTARM